MPFGKNRMGCLSTINVTSSIDPQFFCCDIVRTQWLAGGCVLGYKEDLIIDNFYPASGKAYSEDCLHSYLRTQLGITHNVIIPARAAIENPINAFNWTEFSREMQVRIIIVKIMKGNVFRKIVYIFSETIRRLFRTYFK